MLKNFRLISESDIKELAYDHHVIYAIIFDVDGAFIKLGWSKYPSQRIPTLLAEQALEPKEIWIADFDSAFVKEQTFDKLRTFTRRLQRLIEKARVRHEFFRVPMRQLDDAFSEALTATY